MKKVNIYIDNYQTLEAKTNIDHNITFSGELVFTTSMTGYQEIITDPSFASQIVIMTYPLIGNYGFKKEWNQSEKIYAKGIIVNQIDYDFNNKKSNFEDFLEEKKIPLIHSIDTRNLVHLIRKLFYPKCVISTKNLTDQEIKNYLAEVNPNIVDQISVKKDIKYHGYKKNKKKIAVLDFGIKTEIIEQLKYYFEEIILLPFDTKAEKIMSINTDAIMLSNGPGDPAVLNETITNIKQLLGKINIFGICLGHQIIALALGYKTKIMKFGHRGGNHPVINTQTQKIIITTQNHGYEIDENTIDANVLVTHRNLHDNSIEGIKSLKYKAQSVQFHPEASPGPNDARIIFQEWFE